MTIELPLTASAMELAALTKVSDRPARRGSLLSTVKRRSHAHSSTPPARRKSFASPWPPSPRPVRPLQRGFVVMHLASPLAGGGPPAVSVAAPCLAQRDHSR